MNKRYLKIQFCRGRLSESPVTMEFGFKESPILEFNPNLDIEHNFENIWCMPCVKFTYWSDILEEIPSRISQSTSAAFRCKVIQLSRPPHHLRILLLWNFNPPEQFWILKNLQISHCHCLLKYPLSSMIKWVTMLYNGSETIVNKIKKER